jgi:hypothetical protein
MHHLVEDGGYDFELALIGLNMSDIVQFDYSGQPYVIA